MSAKIILKLLTRIESPDGPIYTNEIDGVVVHGGAPLTPESKSALQEIIAACRRHHTSVRGNGNG